MALKTLIIAVPLVATRVTDVALAAPFDVAMLTPTKPAVVVEAAIVITLPPAPLVFLKYKTTDLPAVRFDMFIVLAAVDALCM